jgi:hypothetical protein
MFAAFVKTLGFNLARVGGWFERIDMFVKHSSGVCKVHLWVTKVISPNLINFDHIKSSSGHKLFFNSQLGKYWIREY